MAFCFTRAGWWGCCSPFATTRTGKAERATSFCSSELWCTAHLYLKTFPIKACWANREHRSQSHKEESLSWCSGWPAHGAGLVFAFSLGFHDVILPLLAFPHSRVCLWPREERVIFDFICPTMHPALSPGWTFGCSVRCALSNAQNKLKENLQIYLVRLCGWSSSLLQWLQPSTQTQNALYTWQSYFSKQN